MGDQFYLDEKIESANRYNIRKFCNFDEGIYDDFTSYFLDELLKLKAGGAYTIYSAECRPDIYSFDIYGTTDYWQLLLRYNNIVNLNQLTLGTVLKFPIMSELEGLYFKLKAVKESRK